MNSVGAVTAQPGQVIGQAILDILDMGKVSKTWAVFPGLRRDDSVTILRRFARMTTALPCAIWPTTMEVDDLLDSRPLLLLSMLVAASSSQPRLQSESDEIYRHALADRVIVQGQRSLDLLHSLLTYLTWYHHRFSPKTQQFFQYLQLANGMAADLGLSKQCEGPSIFQNLDDARTFLLCYYLNCGAAVLGYDRSEYMPDIGRARKAAPLVAASRQMPPDHMAPAMVELFWLAAEVVRSLHDGSRGSTAVEAEVIHEHLHQWKQQFLDPDPSISPSIISSYEFVRGYLFVELNRHGAIDLGPSSPHVVECLQSMRRLLDHILRQPPPYVLELGIIEWGHILTALLVFARLESKCGAVQTPLFMNYIGQFGARVAELRSSRDESYQAPNLIFWLESILTFVHHKAASLSANAAAAEGEKGSTYELLQAVPDRTSRNSTVAGKPQASVSTTGDCQPLEGHSQAGLSDEDVWLDIMSNWLNW